MLLALLFKMKVSFNFLLHEAVAARGATTLMIIAIINESVSLCCN